MLPPAIGLTVSCYFRVIYIRSKYLVPSPLLSPGCMEPFISRLMRTIDASVAAAEGPNNLCDCRSHCLLAEGLQLSLSDEPDSHELRDLHSYDWNAALHALQCSVVGKLELCLNLRRQLEGMEAVFAKSIGDLEQILRAQILEDRVHLQSIDIGIDIGIDDRQEDLPSYAPDSVNDSPSLITRILRIATRDFILLIRLCHIAIQVSRATNDQKLALQENWERMSIDLGPISSSRRSVGKRASAEPRNEFAELLDKIVGCLNSVMEKYSSACSCLFDIFEITPNEWVETFDLIIGTRYALTKLCEDHLHMEPFKLIDLETGLVNFDTTIEQSIERFVLSIYSSNEAYVLEDISRQDWQSNSVFRKGQRVSYGVFFHMQTMVGILSDLSTHNFFSSCVKDSSFHSGYMEYSKPYWLRLALEVVSSTADSIFHCYK